MWPLTGQNPLHPTLRFRIKHAATRGKVFSSIIKRTQNITMLFLLKQNVRLMHATFVLSINCASTDGWTWMSDTHTHTHCVLQSKQSFWSTGAAAALNASTFISSLIFTYSWGANPGVQNKLCLPRHFISKRSHFMIELDQKLVLEAKGAHCDRKRILSKLLIGLLGSFVFFSLWVCFKFLSHKKKVADLNAVWWTY